MHITKYLFIVAFMLVLVPGSAFAVVKDSDVDGLTDDGETKIYQTDPNTYDTDSDGVGDGEEVLDGTNPLDANDSRIAVLAEADPGFLGDPQKYAWYLARITGITAYILFSLVVIYGLFVSNARVFVKWVLPPTSLTFHRYLSFFALAVLVLHMASFLFDHYINLTIGEILIPFFAQRDITSVLGYDLQYAIAFGVMAFYILVVLIITAEFRKKLFTKAWRGLHYLSFFGYILFTAHGFTVGSDSGEWWMRGIYSVSVTIVLVLLFVRIVSAIALARKKKQALGTPVSERV